MTSLDDSQTMELADQSAVWPAGSPPSLGAIHISDRVVAKIAAAAAASMPDVGGPTPGLARLPGGDMLTGTPTRQMPKVSAHVDGQRAYLDVAVSMHWPASIPELTARLREYLRDTVHDLTGLQVAEINIDVTDLIADTADVARVH